MSGLEVSARMKVRDGQLEGFKRQAAECVRQTKEKDTRTLRYDLFLSDDGSAFTQLPSVPSLVDGDLG